MKKNIIYISLLLIITTDLRVQGQEGIAQLKNLRCGKLGNGFNYFIKHLEEPQKKTSMKFYIKAGYNQEDVDQLQLAHLLEHVVFKPTDNFPEGIKKQILKVNMNTGDVGGATGFKSTQYRFDAPSQNKQAIQLGLKWFKEIAMGLKLTDKSIDQERGVVKQEFIFGSQDGLQNYYTEKNLESKLFPCRSSFDSFLNHIQTFPNENLRRFYKDWYRPDLMGVVIVGNIQDMQTMEQLVRSIFGEIAKDDDPRIKTNCDSLYFERSAQFVIEELKLDTQKIQGVEYQLFFRLPELAKNKGTIQGYKKIVTFQLLLEVMRERFQQKQIANDNFFRILVENSYKYDSTPFAYTILFKSKEQYTKKAFQHVFTTLQQFRKYGILGKEWKKVKKKYMNNKVKKDVRYWRKQLSNYFVKGEALFKNKQQIIHRWVKNLSVEEFDAITKKFLHSMPDDIGIIAPTGSNALQYTEKQVRLWIKEANRLPIKPYQFPKRTEQLMTSKEISKLKKVEFKVHGRQPNGTREIVLENGIKVVLKPYQPTRGVLKNKIKLHGFSPVGAACFAGQDYYSALNAPSIIKFNGIGEYSNPQVKSFMKISNIDNCTPYIGYKNSGIHALTGRSNVEEMLQLVYLYFTQPKMDKQLFEGWKNLKHRIYKRKNNAARDFKKKIRYYFQDSILPYSYGGLRFLNPIEAFESIKKTNMKRGFEIYQQLFGNPEEFTFVITGSFDINHILPLIQKYLGNIPQDSSLQNCDGQNRPNKPNHNGPVYKTFITSRYQMESVKYALSFVKTVKKKNTWKETLKLELLGELTDIMLNRLRYKKGFAVYNFWASGSYNHDQFRHMITFDITCQIEELKPIQQECHKIIHEIKRGEIKKAHFQQAIKKIQNRYAKQTLLLHRNMQKLLYEEIRYRKLWVGLEQYDKFLRTLNIEDIIKMANKYFKKEYQYEFVMSDQPL